MPATIVDVQSLSTEVVLSERIVSTEFIIIEINESISRRQVRVEIELGPFTSSTMPGGQVEVRGSSRRGLNVWSGDEYDAIRDTWTNADLMVATKICLEA